MTMRRMVGAIAAVLALSTSALAADVALTSVGQSPDAVMVRVVLRSLAVEADFDALMAAEALTDQKVLIAVVGGSSKGLGAAGINQDQEIARVKALCDAAVAKDMKILMMHVGGEGRRGTLSDLFITEAVPYGDRLIVVDGGNNDGLFNGLAKDKDAEILTAPNVRATQEPLQTILANWGIL